MLNPTLSDLIGGIQSVTLSDEEARRRGTQKSILERKAPPTFDVLVEIQAWDRVAVHLDVAATVDQILRGQLVPAQIRSLSPDGFVQLQEAAVPFDEEVAEFPRLDPRVEVAPAPRAAPPPNRPTKAIRVYAYGVSLNRLEQAALDLGLPVEVTKELRQADAVLTLKNYYRKKATAIQEAEDYGVPVYVLKSNTVIQIQQSLASLFHLDVPPDPVAAAMQETQDAINQVLAQQGPVELAPQNAYIRRLQHQMAEQYNLASRSEGREPYRRVRIFHTAGGVV
jgi:hypothetical protein